MSRDGTGTYTPPAVMATANAIASSVTVNSIIDDIAQALTDSINKDGTKAYAASQSMGGNRVTSLGAGTALTDAAQVTQVQRSALNRSTTVGGTVDAITLAFTPAITAYTTGMMIRWVSGGANTITAPTVNVDTIGVKTLKKNPASAALAIGDLGPSGTIIMAEYNGTDFIVLNPAYQGVFGAGSAALPSIIPTGDANTGFWFPAADTIAASTGGSERLRVDSGGNVGIGVAPSAKLDMVGEFLMRGASAAGSVLRVTPSATGSDGIVLDTSFITGGAGPLVFKMASVERMRIDASGNILNTSSGGLGYGTGSGGTVTQLTSRTTAVTLNKTNGAITMFSAAGSAAWSSFTVSNSTVVATDTIILTLKSFTNTYLISPVGVGAGSFSVLFSSVSGTAVDAPVINFSVIKAVTA